MSLHLCVVASPHASFLILRILDLHATYFLCSPCCGIYAYTSHTEITTAVQLEGCTSCNMTTILQHGHALLVQLVCHLSPERSKVQKHTRSCRRACFSALEKRWNKIHEMVATQSSIAFVAAFQSLVFQDAAPGKVVHESLMNSILFNTGNRATALLSFSAQAKCHDPRGSGPLAAGGGLTGGSRSTTSSIGYITPQVTWSPEHHTAAVMNAVPPAMLACCAIRLSEASLQMLRVPKHFPLAHLNLHSPPLLELLNMYTCWKISQCTILYHFTSVFYVFLLLFPCSLPIKEYSQETVSV